MRVIGSDGSQLGIRAIAEAVKLAMDNGHDLVEIGPTATPPVCKIIDYSKFRYAKEKQRKEARKHQKAGHVKDIRFRPRIGEHDFDTKMRAIIDFLKRRDKVRISVLFRGREMEHKDLGMALIDKIKEQLGELAVIETSPQLWGNRIVFIMAPKH